MRADRKREIEQQLKMEKKELRRNGFNKFTRTLSIIYFLALGAFIYMIFKLDAVPSMYLYPGLAVLGILSLFIIPALFSRKGKTGRKVFSTFISICLICVFGVGAVYMNKTADFIDDITTITEETEDYYVVVREDSPYTDISDLSYQTLGTILNSDVRYAEAKAALQADVPVEFGFEESANTMFYNLITPGTGNAKNETALTAYASQDGTDGTANTAVQTADPAADNTPGYAYNAVFISAASYEGLTTEDESIETATRVLYSVALKIETKDNTSKVNVTKESFNIYISGADYQGQIASNTRTDVNIIVTVNPVTNTVLLTSIPRDYFVNLPSKGASDKLTHSSLYGIQESISAIEETLGIDINYYMRVNFTTIIKLVDALGGIDVESDYDFYTSGMKGMPELNGCHFVKGINHMDGKHALAFCRERHSFNAGDMQRNENQQHVLEAIIKKATSSSAILTNYTDILDAIAGNMEVSMSQEEMSSLIKMQIKKMPSWEIDRQAIKGDTGSGYCYTLGCYASIVNQNEEMNVETLDEIVRVMTGETKAE